MCATYLLLALELTLPDARALIDGRVAVVGRTARRRAQHAAGCRAVHRHPAAAEALARCGGQLLAYCVFEHRLGTRM